MRILDCETIDTTYESLEAILRLSRKYLSLLFDSLSPDDLADQHPENQSQGFLSFIQAQAGCQVDFDATCWFHCTRTWEQDFEEGLLPHSLIEERVWDFLYELADDRPTQKKWEEMKESARRSELYAYRLQSEDGPFGLLIRESAIAVAGDYGWNYFDLPELVDNICRVLDLHDVRLRERYRAHTRPTIVKFRTSCHRRDELAMASFYAYRRHHRLDISWACNLCYDAKGQVVPKDHILSVQQV
jgi:hypothetical protein